MKSEKFEIFLLNFFGLSCSLGAPKIQFKSFFQKSLHKIKWLLFFSGEFWGIHLLFRFLRKIKLWKKYNLIYIQYNVQHNCITMKYKRRNPIWNANLLLTKGQSICPWTVITFNERLGQLTHLSKVQEYNTKLAKSPKT